MVDTSSSLPLHEATYFVTFYDQAGCKELECLYGAYLFNPENTEPCVIRVHRIVSAVKRGQLAVECHI